MIDLINAYRLDAIGTREFFAQWRVNLRFLMDINGLSQALFANASGLSRATVSLLLRAKTCPDLRTFLICCAFFQVDPLDFLFADMSSMQSVLAL